MLAELVVQGLGVIDRASLQLGPGMTAITGETGAGKTLVVEAIGLLTGARADANLVRAGCREARVDGRFVVSRSIVPEPVCAALDDAAGAHDGEPEAEREIEIVLTRVVNANGRSRAYVDGRPIGYAALAELGSRLVDLHGQHANYALLGATRQRDALDRASGVDTAALRDARERVRALLGERAGLGGNARARLREIELVRHELNEIANARITDIDEATELAQRETVLADAQAHREAAQLAHDLLADDGGARDLIAQVRRRLAGREAFAESTLRLEALDAEIGDLSSTLRSLAEGFEDDPETLTNVQTRRSLLRDLCRKYGEDLAAVLAYEDDARQRLERLTAREARAASIDGELAAARHAEETAFARVVAKRRVGAPRLAAQVESRLGQLAMPHARLTIEVDGRLPEHGEGTVTFLLAANPGSQPLPIQKSASGGELARVMLALRLGLDSPDAVDGGDPPTSLFDEVDAGVGGQAANAVGAALAALANTRQVLVVTHLAQVASHADHQIVVTKIVDTSLSSTSTHVEALGGEARRSELARMLSGSPDSASAQAHAEELLRTRGATADESQRAPDDPPPTQPSAPRRKAVAR